ncbi:DUF6151 family protein [Boseongicola sp. H5]|uniref:DUF6151 family protein n=1 Tax=Boseongicola sp. H5 TaxID=2763261 RepID=UPI001D0A6F48|nr:DUF6151 family protein [Boseongicola sp. H5]
MSDLRFSCTCGALTGHLVEASPRAGAHVICHCEDCRRTLAYYNIPLPADEGVGLFQTNPDNIRIDTGRRYLGLMRLSPRGLFRWYATCCNTPLFNSSTRPRFPFSSVLTRNMVDTDPLGPVVGQVFKRGPNGKTRHQGMGRLVAGMMLRTGSALVTGKWRQTPFFNIETGEPVATPVIAPKDAGRAHS